MDAGILTPARAARASHAFRPEAHLVAQGHSQPHGTAHPDHGLLVSNKRHERAIGVLSGHGEMRGGREEPRQADRAVAGGLLEGDGVGLKAGLNCQEAEEPSSEK